MRINQYLARSGLGSRRKVESLVESGQISVNGILVTNLSTEIKVGEDTVTINGAKIILPKLQYLMLNKPKGYTVTRTDAHAEQTVFELLPRDKSLITVGRLDRDTSGMLLVTNDGHFAQNVIHPSHKVEKEYYIKAEAPITRSQGKILLDGVELEDGLAKAKSISIISNKEISIVIEEGRNRIVRRMIAAIGNNVMELRRDRIGTIRLDVKTGKFRELTAEEIKPYA